MFMDVSGKEWCTACGCVILPTGRCVNCDKEHHVEKFQAIEEAWPEVTQKHCWGPPVPEVTDAGKAYYVFHCQNTGCGTTHYSPSDGPPMDMGSTCLGNPWQKIIGAMPDLPDPDKPCDVCGHTWHGCTPGDCRCGRQKESHQPVCDTPGCGRPIPPGGEGHPEICPTCLACLELHDQVTQTLAERRDGYDSLRRVLKEAVEQTSKGKGLERHATKGEAFEDQQIVQDGVWMGNTGFQVGQARKKLMESTRLDSEHAKTEILGAIVYAAAAYLVIDRIKR